MKKKRVLLLWWEVDNRPELLKPFIEMSDEIEFIHLIHRFREERTGSSSPFNMLYWFDYSSPGKLLRACNPDLVVGTTEGLMPIALINECRKQGIPVYGLQHGIAPDNLNDLLPDFTRPTLASKKTLGKYGRIALFYFSSFFSFKFITFFQAVKIFILHYVQNTVIVLNTNQYKWLRPHYYICFSEFSSRHYRQMYQLLPGQIRLTGFICFDDLFNTRQDSSAKEDYYLLIDTNFEEYKKPISQQLIYRCYSELAKYCKKNNAVLKVKLHPWSYKYDIQLPDTSVQFYRAIDAPELYKLIINAKGCFGFYSTLTLPIAAIKPLLQVRYDDVYLKFLVEQGITKSLDFFNFLADDIVFDNKVEDDPVIQKVKQYLLYKTDGGSVERLKQIILNS